MKHVRPFNKLLIQPGKFKNDLDAGYRAMAADTIREAEASKWIKMQCRYPVEISGDRYPVTVHIFNT
jgi:hypothetical protein